MSVCPLTMKDCPGPENCFPATSLLRPDLPKEHAICPIVCACDCLVALASLSDMMLSKSGVNQEQKQVQIPDADSDEAVRNEFIEKVIQPDQEVR